MSDELDEIQADVTNGQSNQIESDEAFCARMRAAIEAGLENAPIGVVTTFGTKNPSRAIGASLLAARGGARLKGNYELASRGPTQQHLASAKRPGITRKLRLSTVAR